MKALFAMALTTALTAAPVRADCPYPAAPDKLPNGSSATLEEMVAGQKAVRAYDKAINDYVSCIDHELERSEEHTSELQSQSNLVCRLLLEKKKKAVNVSMS